MDTLRKYFEGNDKNKFNLLIIFMLGITLFLVGGTKKKTSSTNDIQKVEETIINNDDYVSYLENKLKNILSEVQGAGEVDVMITLSNEGEKTLAFDYTQNSKETNEVDTAGGTRAIKDESISTNAIYNGSSPVILKESQPDVEGVLILAEGGDDVYIVEAFTKVAQALLDVPAHKIQVLKKK